MYLTVTEECIRGWVISPKLLLPRIPRFEKASNYPRLLCRALFCSRGFLESEKDVVEMNSLKRYPILVL
jgi:hypothetical protein